VDQTGAEYELHWAYIPLKQVEPPNVLGVSQPIDRFIRSRLAKEGVLPVPQAD